MIQGFVMKISEIIRVLDGSSGSTNRNNLVWLIGCWSAELLSVRTIRDGNGVSSNEGEGLSSAGTCRIKIGKRIYQVFLRDHRMKRKNFFMKNNIFRDETLVLFECHRICNLLYQWDSLGKYKCGLLDQTLWWRQKLNIQKL